MQRLLRARTDFQRTHERNLLTSLLLYENLTTTKTSAKLLVSRANQFMNRVKSADLSAKRFAAQELLDRAASRKVFEEILPRYQENETTYCRLVPAAPRRGDNAPQAMVVLTKTLANKNDKK